jgi:hypothetical protein
MSPMGRPLFGFPSIMVPPAPRRRNISLFDMSQLNGVDAAALAAQRH